MRAGAAIAARKICRLRTTDQPAARAASSVAVPSREATLTWGSYGRTWRSGVSPQKGAPLLPQGEGGPIGRPEGRPSFRTGYGRRMRARREALSSGRDQGRLIRVLNKLPSPTADTLIRRTSPDTFSRGEKGGAGRPRASPHLGI